MSRDSSPLKLIFAWLIVGVFFYLVDCVVVTLVDKASPDQPWYERGFCAGGPFGMIFTVGWLVFPVLWLISRRIKTRPRA
jgi:hypothetical protein